MRTPRTIVAFAGILAGSGLADAQDTTRVSVDSTGVEGDNSSNTSYSLGAVSADGRIVAFSSNASNLVPGDTNGVMDVFVHDRSTGVTERVSKSYLGGESDGVSWTAAISANGRIVAFASGATNLVAGDTNGCWDIFVYDRATGVTERASVDSAGAQANADSSGGVPLGLSADGRIVLFTSTARNLVPGDTNGYADVFVHDRSTGITERASVDTAGAQGNSSSSSGAISADGNAVAFYSSATNLVAADTNGKTDVFVHDRSTGITERMSVDSSGAQANSDSFDPTISADGTVVAFASSATNLVAGDTNGADDVFLHDRSTGITERVSVDSTGAEGNKRSWTPTISGDLRFVAFASHASNLVTVDTNGVADVFVHDRSTGLTECADVDASGSIGNSGAISASISADGEVVAFTSGSTNLVSGDTNNANDIFVRVRCDAYWTTYGAGFPGTNGVPALTAQTDPVLGASLTIDFANSSGSSTSGLVVIGYQRAQIHSGSGGDLLVDPAIVLLLTIPSGGTTVTGLIPDDESLCGLEVDLQAIESDPGAAKGISFTPGLALLLGR